MVSAIAILPQAFNKEELMCLASTDQAPMNVNTTMAAGPQLQTRKDPGRGNLLLLGIIAFLLTQHPDNLAPGGGHRGGRGRRRVLGRRLRVFPDYSTTCLCHCHVSISLIAHR